MKAIDFEYDGICLSDKGFMICYFDSTGVETISNGSNITFNTVPTMYGSKFEMIGAQYEEYITTTFQICKRACCPRCEEVSIEDMRDIMRWLNRKNFHKFKLKDIDYAGMYFEATFNVSKIEFNGKVYGFELEMITNRPFAVKEPVIIHIDNKVRNGKHTVFSMSDEEGYIYPDMEITVKEDGDLIIHNSLEDRTMTIRNCKAGEVIKINYPMISTDKDRKIQNDFEWIFFRIATTFKDRRNDVTISLPCSVKIKYNPIVKVGI